jgi:hypothetical protein
MAPLVLSVQLRSKEVSLASVVTVAGGMPALSPCQACPATGHAQKIGRSAADRKIGRSEDRSPADRKIRVRANFLYGFKRRRLRRRQPSLPLPLARRDGTSEMGRRGTFEARTDQPHVVLAVLRTPPVQRTIRLAR